MLTIDGRPAPTSFAQVPMIRYRLVTLDYFRAMGAAVRRGRAFTTDDAAGAPLVTIVNETMARRFWPMVIPSASRSHFPPESLLPNSNALSATHHHRRDCRPSTKRIGTRPRG